MYRKVWAAGACLLALVSCGQKKDPPAPASSAPPETPFIVTEPKTLTDVLASLSSGETTSEKLTQSYLDRIAAIDDAGPTINAVIATNPNALANAQGQDQLKAGNAPLGALHGAPILVKDNIETLDPVATTAGSLALKDNIANRDAPVVARLRAAGAVILGKTNLSEWANFRASNSTSGWSAVGGVTRNPHVLDRNPCGSSSGSGAAVAAGLAAAAIGTETDGSIACPASANGLVGIKPTVGLVSRTGIVPISSSQDTAGPLTLTVADAALLLTVMAGSDPADPATRDADEHKADYSKALDPDALKGKRIGVARFLTGYNAPTDAAFEVALKTLADAGAELVEIKDFPNRKQIGQDEKIVLQTEFKAGLNAYLAATPESVKVRSLDDLIAFNKETPAEMVYFGQDILEASAETKGLKDPKYLKAKEEAKRLAGKDGIDRLLAKDKLDAIVAPTGGPAWPTDLVTGDHFLGSAAGLPAVAGYPHITVPMGAVDSLPIGLSIFGAAWSEEKLIGIAYAYEQLSHLRPTAHFLAHTP
jgi:amidase